MIKLSAASLTHTGCVRKINEDTVWTQVFSTSGRPPTGLFIVCDGMGGHLGGEIASYWAVEAVKRELADLFVPKDPRATVVLSKEELQAVRTGKLIKPKVKVIDLETRVKTAIQKANLVVFEYAHHKPQEAGNAGTTLTMAVVQGEQAVIANIGDSRTYLLRNHEIHQVTSDHSVVASLVESGQILPHEIYDHSQRNVIYRWLGQNQRVQTDIFHETLQPSDSLLLCSDGLWEMVRSKHDIACLMDETDDPADACRVLVEAAIDAGGEDNISVIVVQFT